MHPGPYEIPEITLERERLLLERLQPMILRDGVPRSIEIPDLYNVAFTWDPKVKGDVEDLEWMPEHSIQTLHSFGYHGLFKPSVGEVLAQIPDDLPKEAVGFTVQGPSTVDDLNLEKDALNAGFHVATTTFWKLKD